MPEPIAPLGGSDLAAALARLGLDPSGLTDCPLPGTDERAWLLPTPEAWLPTWTHLRDGLAQTGRWPLTLCTDFGDEPADLFTRFYFEEGDDPDLDTSAQGLIAATEGFDVAAALAAYERSHHVPGHEPDLEFKLSQTEELVGSAPTLAELLQGCGDAPTGLAVERWLLSWELAHADGYAADAPEWARDTNYLGWYPPDSPVIALLPDDRPWASLAWVGHYSCSWPSPVLRVAQARQWFERFGAQPCANWGTMICVLVSRPPSDIDEAWEVARAMALLWPDTTILPGVPMRKLARDLVGRDRWFLHYRP